MSIAIEDCTDREPDAGLQQVVERVCTGPPSNYQPGEIEPATSWFPRLAAVTGACTCVAQDEAGTPVGYCLSMPLVEHADVREAAAIAMTNPDHTLYLAELGVDQGHRRQRIAGRLLACATAHAAGRETIVRSLVDNSAAIDFYMRHDFSIVYGVRQMHHGRERLYLHRPSVPGGKRP